jgi:hypothetical protein
MRYLSLLSLPLGNYLTEIEKPEYQVGVELSSSGASSKHNPGEEIEDKIDANCPSRSQKW